MQIALPSQPSTTSAASVTLPRVQEGQDSQSLYRELQESEIQQLEQQGCTAEDWTQVLVAAGCDLKRIRLVTFLGQNRLGACRGYSQLPSGLRFPTGVVNATLQDCTLGDEVLVRNVRQGVARYDIEDFAVISDISSLAVVGETRFGNGQEVHVLREDGTLPVTIFAQLSSNIASLLTNTRADSHSHLALQQIIERYVDQARSDRGRVGRQAVILDCGTLSDLWIGDGAKVVGATRLSNTTLSSQVDAPVEIGEGVIIVDSIVASGTHIGSGASVTRCFVGQGVRMGKQFSAVDSLFFANAEAYHGEACSLLAGPYTVTHHKSTLLIAAQTSFFNAGAGTNQCNHAYKTGPAHYGVLERGSKTGGSSCVSWPANIGAFSTVLGKHRSGFDTRDFPFSFIVEHEGQTRLIPGINLTRVGLWRDVRKWHARDRRHADGRLDQLHFDAMSPWTVQRMVRARGLLDQLSRSAAAQETGWVEFAGVKVKQTDLRRGRELYDKAIRQYLSAQIMARVEAELANGGTWQEACPQASSRTEFGNWFDVGGCFAAQTRLQQLLDDVKSGRVDELAVLQEELVRIHSQFDADQQQWAWQVWLQEHEQEAAEVEVHDLVDLVEDWRLTARGFLQCVANDAADDLALAEIWDNDRRSFQALTNSPANATKKSALLETLEQELQDIQSRAERLLEILQDQPVTRRNAVQWPATAVEHRSAAVDCLPSRSGPTGATSTVRETRPGALRWNERIGGSVTVG